MSLAVKEPERFKWLKDKEKATISQSSMGKQLRKLRDSLLEIGGEVVLLPMIESDIGVILERGRLMRPKNLKMKKGENCHCHTNSAYLWDDNKDQLRICTGYALTNDDGIWRQHSWCWDKRGQRVIETTTRRQLYYGVRFRKAEAKKFFYSNC